MNVFSSVYLPLLTAVVVLVMVCGLEWYCHLFDNGVNNCIKAERLLFRVENCIKAGCLLSY